MVHTQFRWSHGGNQVFLCGDFTGWIRYQEMVAEEGSSTTFTTICDLPPGLHKFKFLVDGVWRVDEQQLFTEDDYGVNNVVLVKQPELMPETILIEDGLPVMEIDGFDDTNHDDDASTSGNIPREPVLAVPCGDVETTRHRLSEHLSSYTAYELIPVSGKVFALDDNSTVEEAFLVMHAEGLAVAPIWDDANQRISGMLTASDFILFLMEFKRNHAMVTNNFLGLSSVSAWKKKKFQPLRRSLIQAHPDESLNDVAITILQNRISAIPVLYVAQDTTCPQLLDVACLGRLLQYIHKQFEHCTGYLPLLQHPIGGLRIGTWNIDIGGARELITLLPNHLLSDALKLLINEHISSVPIVDDKGALIDVFSRSDITSLARDNVYVHIQLGLSTVSQALQLVNKRTHARFGICTRSDSLFKVITLLSEPGVRRVVVVEPSSQRVLGLITLRDVFSLIFRDFH